MFSCVTVPSIATCPCASAISASNIEDDDGALDGLVGPGMVVGGGAVVVCWPVHPIAPIVTATPNKRVTLMLPSPRLPSFRFHDLGHPMAGRQSGRSPSSRWRNGNGEATAVRAPAQ